MTEDHARRLFESNKATLKAFKINMNVVVHPQPAALNNKVYGAIVGFELNSVGEVILVIRQALYEAVHESQQIFKLHPSNGMNVIEVLS